MTLDKPKTGLLLSKALLAVIHCSFSASYLVAHLVRGGGRVRPPLQNGHGVKFLFPHLLGWLQKVTSSRACEVLVGLTPCAGHYGCAAAAAVRCSQALPVTARGCGTVLGLEEPLPVGAAAQEAEDIPWLFPLPGTGQFVARGDVSSCRQPFNCPLKLPSLSLFGAS